MAMVIVHNKDLHTIKLYQKMEIDLFKIYEFSFTTTASRYLFFCATCWCASVGVQRDITGMRWTPEIRC